MRWLFVSYYYYCYDSLFGRESQKGGFLGACKLPEHILQSKKDVVFFIIVTTDKSVYHRLKDNQMVMPICVRKENSILTVLQVALKTIIAYRRHKIDVIYSTGYLSAITSLIARILRVTHISRFFGTFLFQAFESGKWNLRLVAELISMKLYKDGIIITDDGTKGDEVLKRLGVPKGKYFFRKNGLDKEELARIRAAVDIQTEKARFGITGRFIVTNISRLASWKRVDLVIKAFAKYVHEASANDATLVIVGEGRERERLSRLAEKLEVDARFLGNLPRLEVMKIMAISDCLTCFYEVGNVGNVLLEAMALGKCVFARNTGGTNSVISHLKNGILLPSDENELPDSFCKHLVLLRENPHIRWTIEEGARIYAETNIQTWPERAEEEYQWVVSLYSRQMHM